MQLRDRDVFQTATDPADEMLVRINVRIEAPDRSG
jgi:hypothetical protein